MPINQVPPGFENVSSKKPTHSGVFKPHTCRNCGIVGHLYKDCTHPIMSFGIICYRMAEHGPEYLMIQRKDSLCFMEFIRGKYQTEQVDYVRQLLSGMTQDEHRCLMTMSFEELWNHVWYQAFMPKYTSEFHESRRKFEQLRAAILPTLLAAAPSVHAEPEWGFPKGRRRLREEDIDCAKREFCEETGFVPGDFAPIPGFAPFEEIFFGTNHVLYRHVYYVSRMVANQDRVITIDPNNISQAREVRAVRWFSFQDALARIRVHNRERRELFFQIHTKVLQHEERIAAPPPGFLPHGCSNVAVVSLTPQGAPTGVWASTSNLTEKVSPS